MYPSEFLIYRSSAGSGKTQTLAGEYLRIILSGRSLFRQVLAITFTNKAAGEMKERVLHLLHLFASDAPLQSHHQTLLEDIAAAAGEQPSEIRRRAAFIHSNIIHHYSDFNVGTIDSFVHRIIRSFAMELNLSFSFEVQLDTDRFISLAVDQMLEQAGADKELTDNLVSFTRSLLDDEKSWNISLALNRFARFLTKEESIDALNMLMDCGNIDLEEVSDANKRKMAVLTTEWKNIAARADALIQDCGVDVDHFSYKHKGVYGYFEKLERSGDFGKVFNRHEEAKRMVGFMEGKQNFWSKTTPRGVVSQLEQIQEPLRALWFSLTTSVDEKYPEYLTRKLVQEQLASLSLARKIREHMLFVSNSENVIPINEFNRLIWSVVRNQPVPFIYERTSEKFLHFLLDEFQDTSRLQWYNMLPLMDNALAQGGVGMVVGDAKQAIYRWRNGDVQQFVQLPSIEGADKDPLLEERQSTLTRYCAVKNLDHNYRSSRQIISFNNAFFGWLKGQFEVETAAVYKNHHQICGENNPDGYVEIQLLPPVEKELVKDTNHRYALATLNTVKGILQEMEGNIVPGDICILVRTHKEAGIIAKELMNAGIEVVSGESFLFGSFPEPVLVRAMAGVLNNPLDAVNAMVIAARLQQTGRLSVEELTPALVSLKFVLHQNNSVFPWLNDLFAIAGLDRKMEDYAALPLYELCEELIRDVFAGKVSAPAVQHLMEITSAFIQRSGSDLHAYVKHLDDALNRSVPLPETSDSVKIMTIHKSKGLEFPVVIYSFAHEDPQGGNGHDIQLFWAEDHQRWFEGLPVLLLPGKKDIAHTPYSEFLEQEARAKFLDSANLVYVAMTRAVHRLYVISASREIKKESGVTHLWSLLSQFIKQSDLFSTHDEIRFQYGEKKHWHTNAEMQGSEQVFRLGSWKSYDWKNRVGIRPGRLPAEPGDVMKKAVDRGTLVHAILAGISTREDLPDKVDQFLEEGWLTTEDAAELQTLLSSLLAREDVIPFFHPGNQHRRESAIITPEGKKYRPDRVVDTGKELLVLDFKTGETHPGHKNQVKRYARLLEEMGYPKVRGFLLYIDQGELTEVDL